MQKNNVLNVITTSSKKTPGINLSNHNEVIIEGLANLSWAAISSVLDPEDLDDYMDYVITALPRNGNLLKFIPFYKHTPELVHVALSQNSAASVYANVDIREEYAYEPYFLSNPTYLSMQKTKKT